MAKLRKDTPKFIEDAIAVHGDRYDYNEAIYAGSRTPLTIVCKVHGAFKQEPNTHLSGCGCPLCGSASSISLRRYSKQDFITKCESVNPNAFSYDNCDFVHSSKKVTLSCKVHGSFTKSPKSLLQGSGCPKCGAEAIRQSKTITANEYIKRCKAKHAHMSFDFSEVDYKGMDKPVKVVCKEHGAFESIAHNFLHWGSCPSCATGFKSNKKGYLYLIAYFTKDEDIILKCGISNYTPNRIKLSLKKNENLIDAVILEDFKFKRGQDARDLERKIKQELAIAPVTDKQFMPDGWTETFPPSEYRNILNFILRNLNNE